uniref:Variant surface glycoprotein n=1 Tax=Trypanosoma brucei TaxID=5691 RepID=S5FWG6_9TRYP|nr:variant surface glycoprotein [Trypanosoma brucei]
MRATVIAVLTTIITTYGAQAEESTVDQAAAAATEACKAVWFFRSLADNIEADLSTSESVLTTADAATAKLQVSYHAEKSLSRKMAYSLLLAVVTDRANEAREQATQVRETHRKAIAVLRAYAANLELADRLHKRTGPTGQTPTKDTAVTNIAVGAADSCKTENEEWTASEARCADPTTAEPKLSKNKITTQGITKLPISDKSYTTKLIQSTYAFGKGAASSATSTTKGNLFCSDSYSYNSGTIGGTNTLGAITKPKPGQNKVTAKSIFKGEQSKTCDELTNADDPETKEEKMILSTVCQLTKAPLPQAINLNEIKTSSFKEGGEHASYTLVAMKGQGLLPATATEIDKAKAEEFVNALFGKKDSAVYDDFIKQLENKRLSINSKDKEEIETAEKIVKENKIGIAIAFFAGQASKAEATKSSGEQAAVDPSKKSDSEDKTEEKKDGDKTAKPVCSSIQNQTACEAVTGTPPTGKAKVCGWIEGKCQDSSFLTNKQFALSVVSAAFVALLF